MNETKEMRKEFKALGWNSKVIGVRYTRSGSIDVTVKSASVNFAHAKAIAKKYQDFQRCHYTNEILSGGNTFVFVNLSKEAEIELAARYIEAVENVVEQMPWGTSQQFKVTENAYIGTPSKFAGDPTMTLWIDGSHESQYYNDDTGFGVQGIAVAIALHDEDQTFTK